MIRKTKGPAPTVRCAIYTRKSTEEGLDQEFNSLDAQRDSAEAFIKSQTHEGWTCLPEHYDDDGFSGGSMERPALGRLLADIEAAPPEQRGDEPALAPACGDRFLRFLQTEVAGGFRVLQGATGVAQEEIDRMAGVPGADVDARSFEHQPHRAEAGAAGRHAGELEAAVLVVGAARDGADVDLVEVVLTGVLTNICIQHTAADAYFRGYKITVPGDCVDALTDADQAESLAFMKRMYGAEVTDSAKLIKGMEASG